MEQLLRRLSGLEVLVIHRKQLHEFYAVAQILAVHLLVVQTMRLHFGRIHEVEKASHSIVAQIYHVVLGCRIRTNIQVSVVHFEHLEGWNELVVRYIHYAVDDEALLAEALEGGILSLHRVCRRAIKSKLALWIAFRKYGISCHERVFVLNPIVVLEEKVRAQECFGQPRDHLAAVLHDIDCIALAVHLNRLGFVDLQDQPVSWVCAVVHKLHLDETLLPMVVQLVDR